MTKIFNIKTGKEVTKAEYTKETGRWTEEAKIRHSEVLREKWADPEWRAEHIKIFQTPEMRKKRSDSIKSKWSDPEYRAKTTSSQSKGAKNRWADPAERQKQSERIKAARAKKNDNG